MIVIMIVISDSDLSGRCCVLKKGVGLGESVHPQDEGEHNLII